eukprot:snap_masked-scaffold_39-processed-gene-1.49-mRNA-1 protein AED:1.00 eAED:1.00 QI:0/0/0/0/1/1/2/0/454
MKKEGLRLCIVGAGPTGLACLRYLKEINPRPTIKCFEAKNGVGGTWNTHMQTWNEDEVFHSALYDSLRTNLPKEIMNFFDFPFSKSTNVSQSFIAAEKIETYLQDYSKKFDLNQFLHLNHIIKNVVPSSDYSTYKVEIKDLSLDRIYTEVFDVVIACNGHFNKPFFPFKEIPAKSDLHVLHSKDFKENDSYLYPPRTLEPNKKQERYSFKDKVVTIVGFKSSGFDICLNLKNFASRINLISKDYDTDKPVYFEPSEKNKAKIYVYNEFKSLIGGRECEVTDFSDGKLILQSDVIIFCTGYLYDFPFFSVTASKSFGLSEDKKVVRDLYLHMKPKIQNMFFMGLNFAVIPFPLACLQALWIKSYLEAESNIKLDWSSNDFSAYDTHSLLSTQFGYWNTLVAEIGKLSKKNLEFLDLKEIEFMKKGYIQNAIHRPELPIDNDDYRQVKYRSISTVA